MQNKGCLIGTVAVVALILFAMTPYGCGVIWNSGNKDGLQRHMTAIFRSQGVDVKASDCRMVGTTRQGTCDFRATRSDIDKLVKGIPLKRLPKYADRDKAPDDVRSAADRLDSVWSDPNSELAAAYLVGKPVECFATTQHRPRSLEKPIMPFGFEFLVIYYDPRTHQASAFTCYSYS